MIKSIDTSTTSIIERETESHPPLTLRSWIIGRAISTADAPHQTIGKAIGLAVFSSDALSSVAYAPQEMLAILAAAGTVAFGYVFPISPTEVKFRFETQQGGAMANQTATFNVFGEQEFSVEYIPPVTAGSYAVKLVVLRPNNLQAEGSYKIECP